MVNVKVRVNIPESIKNSSRTTYYIKQAFLAKEINSTAKTLSNSGATVKVNSGRMEATIGKLTNRGVIDMKPFFMRSSKVKRKKDGGWYLVIPIKMSSKNIIKTSGRAVYDRVVNSFRDLEPGTSSTLNINGLLSKQTPVDTISVLQPAKATGNITATKGSSGRNSYVAFRTVSDKSSPTSWVLGRKNINDTNTSKSLEHEVGVLVRKRIRQKYGT